MNTVLLTDLIYNIYQLVYLLIRKIICKNEYSLIIIIIIIIIKSWGILYFECLTIVTSERVELI